jgi:hypothetical protein
MNIHTNIHTHVYAYIHTHVFVHNVFRVHEERRAHEQHLALEETEIRNFRSKIFVNQDVGTLEISVNNGGICCVQEAHALGRRIHVLDACHMMRRIYASCRKRMP